MYDELSVLKLAVGRLQSAGIAYMVTGSVALSVYAQPRMTRDVDVVVELRPADAERLAELFGGEFDCDVDRMRAAIERQGMFNLIHTMAVVKIDIIVRKDSAYREEEFRRRRLAAIDNVNMWVVSPEDLLLSKLDWARSSRSEVQLRDVRHLIAGQPTLDWAYVETWAVALGVGALLDEVRQ
jgi:Nucleotidyl transferase AbiEii toxin, Type IV TA system